MLAPMRPSPTIPSCTADSFTAASARPCSWWRNPAKASPHSRFHDAERGWPRQPWIEPQPHDSRCTGLHLRRVAVNEPAIQLSGEPAHRLDTLARDGARRCWRAVDVRDGRTDDRLWQDVKHDPYLVANPDAIAPALRSANVMCTLVLSTRVTTALPAWTISPGCAARDCTSASRGEISLAAATAVSTRPTVDAAASTPVRALSASSRALTTATRAAANCASAAAATAAPRRASARRCSSSSASAAPVSSIVTTPDSR